MYHGYIDLVNINDKGIIWFKLKKLHFGFDNDIYVCGCYIPPADSQVYTNSSSPLFEFDFFDQINRDIIEYSQYGDIVLTGDLNARTGQKSDIISSIDLERYIDMPDYDVPIDNLPLRMSSDRQCNAFGNKLITLCKENSILIVNGRLEPGYFTCYNLNSNRNGASVVDYLIVNYNMYTCINNFCVLELNEFSDHCAINFDLSCKVIDSQVRHTTIEKVTWEQCNKDELYQLLDSQRHIFDNITSKLVDEEDTLDNCIESLSQLIYDLSFHLCGKTIHIGNTNSNKSVHKNTLWFNNECKQHKRNFYTHKRIFKLNPSDDNKINFLSARNGFCSAKRKARRSFYSKEKSSLALLSKNNPRKFWKYINKYKNKSNSTSNNIDIEDFVQHFKSTSNTPHFSSYSLDDHRTVDDSICIDELDCIFTVEEIVKTVANLKRHKSCDMFNNIADFFIDSKEFISPYLATIFNYIFDKGIYPESWSKGAIVPIFKKGERNNPANYRGITLVNVLGKIFSLCLRNRINKWCESENVFNPLQFGFRNQRSTTDCIFILHCIIQNVLLQKHKLYCAFIDFEKAFDTVIHQALWIKLIESGISCKMLKIIQSIYANVKSCIKNAKDLSYSDYFDVTLGVKQGEPLSPLLFILFINDIKDCINIDKLTESDLQLLSIFMLLFADDIALFTTNPETLQNQLNQVHQYSCKWGLKINVNKTKICIFEQKKTKCNFIWKIDNECIDVVDSFVYLGVQFYYTGSMKNVVKVLNEQALKAYNHLLSIFSRVSLDIRTKLSLFDSLVAPIIMYGSEVWGIYDMPEIDKLHYNQKRIFKDCCSQ